MGKIEPLKILGITLFLSTVLLWNNNYVLIICSILLLCFYLVLSLKKSKEFLIFKFSYFIFFSIIIFAPLNLYYDNEQLKMGLKILLMIDLCSPIVLNFLSKEKDRNRVFKIILNHILFSFILISTLK